MQVDNEPKLSSSGLQFALHPLVLINISDHHTRTRANCAASEAEVRVLGCLLGQQAGRTVDISNSFEMRAADGAAAGSSAGSAAAIDEAFLQKKMEQYKQTFPALDVVGWYATGSQTLPEDMDVHKKVMAINESPVFLRLDPAGVDQAAQQDLPVYLAESELHVEDGLPSTIWVQSKYTVETSEAERIGVDQVARLVPSGSGSGSSQLTAHLGSMHSAMQMLVSRVALLHGLLRRMQAGEVPYDHAFVRGAAALVARLPAVDGPQFGRAFLTEYNDSLLSVLLAAVTRGSAAASDIVDKHNLAYDRPSMKRMGKGGGGGGGGMGGMSGMAALGRLAGAGTLL